MRLISSLSLLVVAGLSFGSSPSSKELIVKASQDAAKSGKNVLVIFHASWCGWCHRFDKFLDTTEEGKMVKNGLEVVHVTVLEDPKHKADENEGGLALMEELGGKNAGLPFMAILDSKTGKMVVNSMMKGKDDKLSNTGYPAQPEEIAHFNTMLEKGAKKVNPVNRGKITAWLTANAPKG